jgi:DNA-binding transcriptional LysR family regulator
MARESFDDLAGFLAVARERSFTRAAAKLGVTPSALSHSIQGLEARLGVRLLNRTTRSVSPSEAGERLLLTLAPRFEEIEGELARLRETKDRLAGAIRINATDYVADTILWPKLKPLLRAHREIHLEISIDYAMSDIVALGFDAGVRIGAEVAKDMIAARIGPDFRFVVVGAPSYFKQRKPPKAPADLADHTCINLRLPTYGGLYAWEFERDGREERVRVGGQLTFGDTDRMLTAALDGFGLAYLPEELAAPHFEAGRLKPALEAWWPMSEGYHIYYPSRRQASPAFTAMVEALRRQA